METIRLILGSARSGTTWLQDALAAANDCATVFEPLHPDVSDIGRAYAYRFLSSAEPHSELQKFFETSCRTGSVKYWSKYRALHTLLLPGLAACNARDLKQTFGHWRYYLKHRPTYNLIRARKRTIYKCIRANLMVPWLSNKTNIKTVFIVRNPIDVVCSRLRLPDEIWNVDGALETYRNDRALEQATDGRYHRLLTARLNLLEKISLSWLIENEFGGALARLHGVPVVSYESLKAGKESAWKTLLAGLDIENRPGNSLTEKPSQQVSKDADYKRNASGDRSNEQTKLRESVVQYFESIGFNPEHYRTI